MPRLEIMLATLVAALIASGFWWFASSFERVPVAVETGFRGEARTDRFLAARRLLQALGASVVVRPVLSALPEPESTLILLGDEGARSRQTATRLLDWVEAGGHLVVAVETPQGPLLDALAVRRVELSARFEDSPAEIELGPDGPLAVLFGPNARLEVDAWPALSAASELGLRLVSIERGAGRVTVLADHDFMENGSIGEHDHAAFLWRLTRIGGDGPVWLIRGTGLPALLERALERWWPVLASAAALLTVWLWRAASRFGPRLSGPGVERRRLLEHIVASGDFHWRHGDAAVLLAAAREALLDEVALRHARWRASEHLATRLAKASGLPPAEIEQALAAAGDLDANAFTQVVRTLQRARQEL